MKNVSHKKSWNSGVMQPHMERPSIPLNKSKQEKNPEKYFIKINFVGIQDHLCQTPMCLIYLFFTMAIRKSSCCSCETSI